ncbi:MAG: hypothetical protein QM831_24690 [Kofleriaceae bacterium]
MDIEGHRKTAIDRALTGDGRATPEARREAFDGGGPALLQIVRDHAYKVTDADVAAAQKELGDDQVFELVVCAAYGKADRQYRAALAAIEEIE